MKACDFFNLFLHISLVTALVVVMTLDRAHAQCGSSCPACTERFGCMTSAWGQCCTQFYMHNGKRSSAKPAAAERDNRNIGRIMEFYLLRRQEPAKPFEHHKKRRSNRFLSLKKTK